MISATYFREAKKRNIIYGKAVVCGHHDGGWILPGGRVVMRESHAKVYAAKINSMMRGF